MFESAVISISLALSHTILNNAKSLHEMVESILKVEERERQVDKVPSTEKKYGIIAKEMRCFIDTCG